jgi:putative phosphoribosyl transferase
MSWSTKAQLLREIADFEAVFAQAMEPEVRELARREQAYRPGLGALHLRGETAILVDDGLATGSTMLAALLSWLMPRSGVCSI